MRYEFLAFFLLHRSAEANLHQGARGLGTLLLGLQVHTIASVRNLTRRDVEDGQSGDEREASALRFVASDQAGRTRKTVWGVGAEHQMETKHKAADGAPLHWNQKIPTWFSDRARIIKMKPCAALTVFIVLLCILVAGAYSLAPGIMQLNKLPAEGQKQADVQAEKPHPLREATADKWTKAQLPIIWPKLVKTNATSQLLLPAEKLDTATWCIDLYGFMGVPILCVSSRYVAQGDRVVEVSSRGDDAMVLASVSSFLELRGTSGNWLGRFEIGCDGRCLLREASGCPMVSVHHDANRVQFHIASLPEGDRLASVTRSEGSLVLPLEHFEITVAPGVDVVLVLMCMLASMLFRPQPTHEFVKLDGEAKSICAA